MPARYDDGNEYHHSDPNLIYGQSIVNVKIKESFKQLDYFVCVKLQNVCMKACIKKDFVAKLESLKNLHNGDFEFCTLKGQLILPRFVKFKGDFTETVPSVNISTLG